MILECRGLNKTYIKKKAVIDFNISLKEGKIYGLLGENGSGKMCIRDRSRPLW